MIAASPYPGTSEAVIRIAGSVVVAAGRSFSFFLSYFGSPPFWGPPRRVNGFSAGAALKLVGSYSVVRALTSTSAASTDYTN